MPPHLSDELLVVAVHLRGVLALTAQVGVDGVMSLAQPVLDDAQRLLGTPALVVALFEVLAQPLHLWG